MTKSLAQEKVISFTAEKKVQWIPVLEDIVAYKEDLFFNNELFSSKEGIALLTDVQNAHHLDGITEFKKEVNGRSYEYVLFKKSFLEFIRKNPLNVGNNAEEAFGMLLDKPFTYLEKNSVDEVVPLIVDFGDYEVYDLEGELVPQGIYFGYISQHIDNYHYDLDVLLSAIKNRSDINIFKDKYPRSNENGLIKRIPSYNSESNRDLWIEFVWSPSDEDFMKIKPLLKDRYNRYQRIVSEIFGVETIREY